MGWGRDRSGQYLVSSPPGSGSATLSHDLHQSKPERPKSPRPRPRSPSWRWRPALVILLAVVAGTVLQLLRQRGASPISTIWAEDGIQFLATALTENPITSLAKPSAGYLHIVPRIIAIASTALPIRSASIFLAVGSAVVVSLIGVYVYFATSPWLRSRWARIALAAMMVLLPTAGSETVANVANLHWYLVFAAFWALLNKPSSAVATIFDWIVIVAAASSSGVAIMLAPIAIYRIWRDRDLGTVSLVTVFMAIASLQTLIVVISNTSAPTASLADYPTILGLRVVAPILAGDQILARIVNSGLLSDLAWAATGLVGFVGVFAYLAARRDIQHRHVFIAACGYSAAFFLVAMYGRGLGLDAIPTSAPFDPAGARYFVLPILFLASAIVGLVATPDPRVKIGTWRLVQAAATVVVLVAIGTSFSLTNGRSSGPDWVSALDAATKTCTATGVEIVEVAQAPSGWFVPIPCKELG